MHALLRFVDDMSQALGKTIDISGWRMRYLCNFVTNLSRIAIQQLLCTLCHVCLDVSAHLFAT